MPAQHRCILTAVLWLAFAAAPLLAGADATVVSRAMLAKTIAERFVVEGHSSRLTAAALETLAIVAYKQPISRAQVSAIRGVDVDGVIRLLQQRGFVYEVSRDPGPGNAIFFGTTQEFLERMGLDGLAQLPPLGDFVPGPEVVEALEQGLRADPGQDAAGLAADEGPSVVVEAEELAPPEG